MLTRPDPPPAAMDLRKLPGDLELALQAVGPSLRPGAEYGEIFRKWQGIPGVERTSGGRLWAAWYTGGRTEDENNHVVLVTSADGGASWSEPVLVVDPPGDVRASDPVLWHDPVGRLWLFWMQSAHCGTTFDGRGGVWAVVADNSEDEATAWSPPRRLANGIMMNKPTVLDADTWLLPCAVWRHHRKPSRFWLPRESFSNVVRTRDGGRTFALTGSADVPNRACDEHQLVVLRDGRLLMLVRCHDGIRRAFSADGGCTWEARADLYLGGPSARFHVRRLRSGRLLLLYHDHPSARTNLTAFLSEDDGRTWPWRLLLDERELVSYPDAIETPDGRIVVVYDRLRTGVGEILMQTVTESEILAGRPGGFAARQPVVVSRLHRRRLEPDVLYPFEMHLIDQVSRVSLQPCGNGTGQFLLHGWEEEGEVSLAPVIVPGGGLRLTGSLGPGGSIQAEIESCSGNVLPGFERAQSWCRPLQASEFAIGWHASSALGLSRDRLVRIRLVLRNAEISGFRFQNPCPGDSNLAP